MSNPGMNLIAGVTSQQDNRFRKRQQELDEAWRNSQIDLAQSQLDFKKDMWDTEKGWKEYEFQKGVKSDKAVSEMTKNLWDEFAEKDAYEKAEEAFYDEILGDDVSIYEMFRTDKTFGDWVSAKGKRMWNNRFNPFAWDYEDDISGGIKYAPGDTQATIDLFRSGYATPELIALQAELQRKSPNKQNVSLKSLLDFYKGSEK